MWQDIAARVEKLSVKVCHVDAPVPKSWANEEHHNNEQVDPAARIKVSQVIHDCKTCAAIKKAKRVKPLWQVLCADHGRGNHWTYPVPHDPAQNTILGLEKQVLWRHGTPKRIESENGNHFKNGLIDTWAREHGIEWVYHIPTMHQLLGKSSSAMDC
ncbi:hypothetical protein WISP_25929 [Willisornis vidua]|uniref:Integrase catalytic domain-containing protein n=1 Tax=Willisornis vidua TaxID=1566151 RepID=A0ABQ9DPS9_9PASS|nr:hypothetical protein WISP_25929 [Willisornis vidua]